jgi:hypothetical protein
VKSENMARRAEKTNENQRHKDTTIDDKKFEKASGNG